MLQRVVIGLVGWCWRHHRLVIVVALILSIALAGYAATHLGLDTDEGHMISATLPYRLAEQRMDRLFPADTDQLVAVIDGPTPERTEKAVVALQAALTARPDLFRSVNRPAEEMFFRRHGLLFLSTADLTELSDRLVAAQPMLGELARDPSLRGLLATTDLALTATTTGAIDAASVDTLLDRLDSAATHINQGAPVPPSSWQSLLGALGSRDSGRRVLLTQPQLRYDSLVAGADAEAAIRAAAAGYASQGLTVRLTGPVALSDSNFITVTQGAAISVPLILAVIVGLLSWAVRSVAATLAILLSMVAGLAATGAFAALTVGTLNPISVAFAVMFVGIAVDFGIQFVVRLQDERVRESVGRIAMDKTAGLMAVPLTVAAAATAVGFLSFLPTDYTGVSQLGLIAGGGMVIALVVDFTLLPALLALIPPPVRAEPLGLPWQRADQWLSSHTKPVLVSALLLAAVGALLLFRLPVDFDPLHLQNPKSEAVTTFHDMARDLDNGVYAVQTLAADQAAAAGLVKRFDALPEVLRTESLATFVPDDQDARLAVIADMAQLLGPTLTPAAVRAPPAEAELASALRATADRIAGLARPDAARRAARLRDVADRGPIAMLAMQEALLDGLPALLDQLRQLLDVQAVTLDTLPADLRRNWIGTDGSWRVEVLPRFNLEDATARATFVHDVQAIVPDAEGAPISIVESGKVVSRAFIRAGLGAVAAIGLLLWIMLRRIGDSLLVVVPLVLGALYTVIACVIGGIAINFANIIALPLLLGIGVAFNIYFVINWRQGIKARFHSATARAILFSALTTGSAFGSLAVSPHLGTASMGVLLFISLGLSVLTTFIVLPAIFDWLDSRRR